MIKSFLLSVTCLFAFTTKAQTTKDPFPFNEIGLSANYTVAVSADYPVKNGLGGGVLVYRSFREDKKIKPVIGIDYNYTNFQVDSVSEDAGVYLRDLHFRYHQVRLPISVRFHFGENTSFFVEPGIHINLVMGSYYTGTLHTAINGEENTRDVKQQLQAHSGIGAQFGMGVQTPFRTGQLIVKLDLNKSLDRTTMSAGNPGETFFFYNSYVRLGVIYKGKLIGK